MGWCGCCWRWEWEGLGDPLVGVAMDGFVVDSGVVRFLTQGLIVVG